MAFSPGAFPEGPPARPQPPRSHLGISNARNVFLLDTNHNRNDFSLHIRTPEEYN